MIQTQIRLSENTDQLLAALALGQGKKKEDIIVEAIEALVHKPRTQEEILALRRSARGIWKDRTDLPDFDAIRKRTRKFDWGDDLESEQVESVGSVMQ
jgi:hypothetical protein